MKKDLADLQQQSQEAQEKNLELTERLLRLEQAPKADPVVLAALVDRVEKISMYALELERRVQAQSQAQLQPQMTLGSIRPVSVEDISGLVKKIDELDGMIKSINVAKVSLNNVSFPLGKVGIEDLSQAEMSKLRENAARIKEEKPSKVTITTWADGSGPADTKEKVALERAMNIESYYKGNAGESANIEFLTEFRIASSSGPLWRRAETTMWITRELKK